MVQEFFIGSGVSTPSSHEAEISAMVSVEEIQALTSELQESRTSTTVALEAITSEEEAVALLRTLLSERDGQLAAAESRELAKKQEFFTAITESQKAEHRLVSELEIAQTALTTELTQRQEYEAECEVSKAEKIQLVQHHRMSEQTIKEVTNRLTEAEHDIAQRSTTTDLLKSEAVAQNQMIRTCKLELSQSHAIQRSVESKLNAAEQKAMYLATSNHTLESQLRMAETEISAMNTVAVESTEEMNSRLR